MQQIYRRTRMPKCDFNKVAKHTHHKMSNQLWISVANGNFSFIKSSPSQLFIVRLECRLFAFILHNFVLAIQLQRHLIVKPQPQHKEVMLFAALYLHEGRTITSHSPFWHNRPQTFQKVAAIISSMQALKRQ